MDSPEVELVEQSLRVLNLIPERGEVAGDVTQARNKLLAECDDDLARRLVPLGTTVNVGGGAQDGGLGKAGQGKRPSADARCVE